MKVVMSPRAQSYVLAETIYLRARSLRAAEAFTARLRRLRRDLLSFPEMGGMTVATAPSNVRRFVLGDYLVDYQVEPDRIVILVIRHGRQKPPEIDIQNPVS